LHWWSVGKNNQIIDHLNIVGCSQRERKCPYHCGVQWKDVPYIERRRQLSGRLVPYMGCRGKLDVSTYSCAGQCGDMSPPIRASVGRISLIKILGLVYVGRMSPLTLRGHVGRMSTSHWLDLSVEELSLTFWGT
ncbi:unnamed protein product, partial [Staurois parvus]